MPYERRPDFEPLALDDPLWRYVSFTKFVALLDTQELYLPRVDKLGDKLEGLLPRAPSRGFGGFFVHEDTRRYAKAAADSRDARCFYYASCWHGNENESDAMWKLYLTANQGVAIRTTFRSLRDSVSGVPERLWIANIRYLDTWTSPPTDIPLHACMTKRKAFEHEKEARVLWLDEAARVSGALGDEGKSVKCRIATLIERVYLAPGSGTWLERLVNSVLRKYGLDVNAEPSVLDSFLAP